MSKEKSWINPCGLDLDGRSCKKKKTSMEENIPYIENQINVIIKKLKDLKNFMNSTYKYVNEDSLKSQEYAFLKPPNNEKNVYILAYHILQVNVMAIEELLKQLDEEEDTYRTKLEDIKLNFPGLLCNVQRILISEDLDYKDVTEDVMSKAFKTQIDSSKIEKNFIAIRQIQKNMQYLFDEFKKVKSISSKKLKLKNDNPSI